MRIRGVGVYLHWTVLLIAIIILLNVIRHPLTSLLGLMAYLGVLLIHESGHLIAAQRMHCKVFSIELYPIFGFCRFETPWSRFDHCVIAWGGVIAQALVAAPLREPQPTVDFIEARAPVGAPALVVVVAVVMDLSDEL